MAPLPPDPSPAPKRSLWKPIGITLLGSFVLAFSTCAGGFALDGRATKTLGAFFIYAGLLFLGIFVLTSFVAVIYFIIWLVQKARQPQ
jgi:hypothetical protein